MKNDTAFQKVSQPAASRRLRANYPKTELLTADLLASKTRASNRPPIAFESTSSSIDLYQTLCISARSRREVLGGEELPVRRGRRGHRHEAMRVGQRRNSGSGTGETNRQENNLPSERGSGRSACVSTRDATGSRFPWGTHFGFSQRESRMVHDCRAAHASPTS